MKIRVKIIASFLIIALISLGCGCFAVYSSIKMTGNDEKLYQTALGIKTIQNMQHNLMVVENDIFKAQSGYLTTDISDTINVDLANVQKNLTAYKAYIYDKEQMNLYNAMTNDLNAYKSKVVVPYGRAMLKNDLPEAESIVSASNIYSSQFDQDISKIINRNIALIQSVYKNNTQTSSQMIIIDVILFAALFLIAIVIGFLLTRSIVRPLGFLVDASKKMAAGDFNFSLETKAKDETAEVIREYSRMKQIIEKLVGEIRTVARLQVAGEIGSKINEDEFPGAYHEISEGINRMVETSESDIDKIETCYGEFAEGNFDAPMEQLPGKKAAANERIEKMRANLKNVTSAIQSLVQDAIDGKLTSRADDTAFKGDWKKIITQLNRLLDTTVEPIEEVSDVIKQISEGSLDVRIEGEYAGDFNDLKQSVNHMAEEFQNIVSEISGIFTRLSEGDIDIDSLREYEGSWRPVSTAFNKTVDSLNEIISNINQATDQVSMGARQVSDGSQSLSQGTSEQASAIEELTASIEEIAAQTKKNAQGANEAKKLVEISKRDAVTGNEKMQELQNAMREINEASANIGKIIKVINEIAFQTNMLALNAAVEAARAGQYGKGFAVVAEEVRNLAGRSADAVKGTTELIESAVSKTAAGTKAADETSGALRKIVEEVEKAADLVTDIASASNEQATGIAQINKGIEQVSQVVQVNSATSEESAASSEELSSQAKVLKSMVGRFHLREQSSAAALPEEEEFSDWGQDEYPEMPAQADSGLLPDGDHQTPSADPISAPEQKTGNEVPDTLEAQQADQEAQAAAAAAGAAEKNKPLF